MLKAVMIAFCALSGASVGALLLGQVNKPGGGAYLGGLGAELGFSLFIISPMVRSDRP